MRERTALRLDLRREIAPWDLTAADLGTGDVDTMEPFWVPRALQRTRLRTTSAFLDALKSLTVTAMDAERDDR